MDALIPGWTQAIESGSSPADVYDDVLEGGGGFSSHPLVECEMKRCGGE